MSDFETTKEQEPNSTNSPDKTWLEQVQVYVQSLRYGVVTIVVHDGRVTQIDRTERVRLRPDKEISTFINPAKNGKRGQQLSTSRHADVEPAE